MKRSLRNEIHVFLNENRGGEFSTGTMGKFQPALTPESSNHSDRAQLADLGPGWGNRRPYDVGTSSNSRLRRSQTPKRNQTAYLNHFLEEDLEKYKAASEREVPPARAA